MKLREQRKQELSNRKSLAAKERMRILTKLADSGKCRLCFVRATFSEAVVFVRDLILFES